MNELSDPAIFAFTFDGLVCALLVLCVVREALLIALRRGVAGPGGWLIEPKARARAVK